MRNRISFVVCTGVFLVSSSLSALAQSVTPGATLALSRNVSGTVTIYSVRPTGCPTLVCTTNLVSFTNCFTNCYWKLICTTNASTGQISCTNTLVCVPHCYTNSFPRVTCTNVFSTPTAVVVNQSLSGGISVNGGCDELNGLFSSNAVFQAHLYTTLRTNDWLGSHIGSFKIIDGTNVVAYGSLNGINGGGSHRGLEACALCNHLEGTLNGQIVAGGPLHGARIQATYAGNLTDVTCPSANVPQGAISLGIEGAVVIPCFQFFQEPISAITPTGTAAAQ